MPILSDPRRRVPFIRGALPVTLGTHKARFKDPQEREDPKDRKDRKDRKAPKDRKDRRDRRDKTQNRKS